jgi:hypothetical protein
VGTPASETAGSLIFEHGDGSGVSSIVFKSKNTANDYGYIEYAENVGGPNEKGVLTIGIENNSTGANSMDRISLYAAGGYGYVGVNTKEPLYNFDVSGSTRLGAGLLVSRDSSFNGNLFVNGSIVNTGLTNALGLKAPLAAPSFTGLIVSAGDVSLNAGLRVQRDSSFNANLFVNGTIVNTGLTNALALKAPLAAPSFTGTVTSVGDVSLNAGLRVASDSSFNGNLFISGSIVNAGLTAALALKAPLESPALTGTPTATTAILGTNSTQIATTAYVRSEISALVASAPGTLDTLNELAAALGNDAAFSTTVTNSLALKAPSASPTFTGAFLVSSVDSSFNGNLYVAGSIVNAELTNALSLIAPIASPSFTGIITSSGDVSLNAGLRVALDSSFNANLYVGGSIVNAGLSAAIDLKAPLAAPSFTGLIVSAGDVSLNAGLRVASDSSFNGSLYIGGTINNTELSSSLDLKAPLAAPSFTGLMVSAGDVSLNSGLMVASDSSFNGSLYIGGSIVNTGLSDSLALKAPLAAPSFTGTVTSVGDVSLNAGLRVASDSSFNSNLYVAGSIVNTGLSTALGLKAPLESPALTGTPTATTAILGTNTTQIATTQYVRSEISALIASAPGTLDTLNELALALGNDAAFSTTVTNSLALKAPSASPTFTGAFLVSSADSSFNGNLFVGGAIVNTGLTNALDLKAPLAAPSFTGTVVSAGDASLNAGLRVQRDSSFNGNLFVNGSIVNTGLTTALGLKAPLAAPSFTGIVVSAGDVSLNAGLRVQRDSSFNGSLYIGGTIVNTGLTTALGLKANIAAPSFTGIVVSAGDVSLNAGLRVQRDSSFNGNLFINGSIVNTGLTTALGLKANIAAPSFTGTVVSAGDVSLNAGLRVQRDSSFNGNLYIERTATIANKVSIGMPPTNSAYELDLSGQMRIYETVGTAASATAGSLIFEHADASGTSSIVFKSKNSATDYAYIQYQENVGGTGAAGEKGVFTIGIENDPTNTTSFDRISLFPANGSGYVGVNTKDPLYNFDVSGSTRLGGSTSNNFIGGTTNLSLPIDAIHSSFASQINANTVTVAVASHIPTFYNGIYDFSASSFNNAGASDGPPFRAFDRALGNCWYSSINGDLGTTGVFYNQNPYSSVSPFAYQGGNTGNVVNNYFTTVVGAQTISGEWLQVKLPYSFGVKTYTIVYDNSVVQSTALTFMPSEFYLVGSNNGTTWTLIDYRTFDQTTLLYSSSYSLVSQASNYTHFRLITTKLKGNGGYVRIGDFILSGSPSTYTVGKTTIGNDLQLFGKILTSTSQVVGNLVFNNRPSQNYQDPSFNSMTGYYALDHEKAPVVNYEVAKQAISSWTARYNPGVAMGKVCWSSKLMIFCAVGSTNSYVSSDGITWSSYLIQAGITYNDVVWSNELNIFCAVGQSGILDSENLIATSPNGTVWTIQTHNPVESVGGLKAIEWSPELKIFNATGSFQTNGFQTSYDGITWASLNAMGNTGAIVWANSLKYFIISSTSGNFGIGNSQGTSYSSVYSPLTGTREMVWSEQLGIIISYSGTRVYYSYDGRTWTAANNLTTTSPCVCTWAAELGIFCLIDGSKNCYTSSNGLDWTFIRTMTEFTGTISSGKNLCWSPELSIFCLGPNVAGQSFLTSSLKFRIPTSYNTFNSSLNSIDETGNWVIAKRLTVGNDISLNSNTAIGGSLRVLGDVSLNQKLMVSGDVSLNAGLRVASDASFNSDIFVNGTIQSNDIIPVGNLTQNIGDETHWFGHLYVDHIICGSNSISIGDSTISSNNGSVSLGGNSVIQGTFGVTGDVSFNANLHVASDSSFNANLFVGGSIVNAELTSALALKAPLAAPSFTGSVVSAGDVSLNAGLRVASDSSFNANLFVGGSIVNTELTNTLALKAPLESPALTGTPTATTAVLGTNSTQIATTAYVRSEISALVASAPAALDTLNELALALGNDAAFSTTVTNSLALKAPSASPTFTGAFLVSSADSSFNGNLYVGGSIVNTGLTSALALKAPLASPSFTGDVSMNSGLYVGTRIGVGKTANASYAVDVNGNINLSGNLYNNGILFSSFDNTKDISLNANLTVANDSSFNRGLYVGTRIGVGKTANASYAVDVNGNINLSGNIFTNGVLFSAFDNTKDISLNANLTVARDSSFNANLYVGGIMNVAGFINADAYVERFVTVASSSGTYVANFNNGLIIYVNAFSGSTTPTLSITNLPTVLNQSYVFSVVYKGVSTTTYFSALNINGISVPVNGTVSLTAATTYYVHQFCIFFTDATTISNNFVVQNFSSSAPIGLISPTIYNDSTFNGNINLTGTGNVYKNGVLFDSFNNTKDISLNANLTVARDSSFNSNLFVGGSIVNAGLTSALALKAPLAAPSFTGIIVSAGDVSLNAGLRVASDSSFNANIFVGGSIVNTGLSAALALKAPLAAPSFTGLIVSAGDVSLNAGLRVASDSSFNGNLFVAGSIVNTGLTSNLALKAPLESPALTGIPTSTTASLGTNTTQIATTAYVRGEISALVASAPGTLDTLNELAAALGNDAAFSTTMTNSIGLKAPSASPTFTGNFLVSSADSSFNGNLYVGGSIVNTGLTSALDLKAPIASPSFTGDVSMNAGLRLALDASLNRGLYVGTRIGVGKTANALYGVDISGNVNLSGNIFTNGVLFTPYDNSKDISLNANLIVARDSSFNANLYVGGIMNVAGFVNADAYVERFVTVASSSGTYVANFNNGLVIYVNAFSGSTTPTLSITNLPTTLNQSYVFSVVYRGNATSTYFSALNINGVSVPVNGTVSLTASSTYYVHQFCIFFTDATTISNNFVVQNFSSSAPVGLISPTIYNDSTFNGNINLTGTGNVYKNGVLFTSFDNSKDISLNANLTVARDSSFNSNLFVGGSIINTGLTSALALKAPLAAPSFTGIVSITDSAESASKTTGALIVTGGAGIGGNVQVGGNVKIAITTASTNSSTGALIVGGGVGIDGVLNTNNNINTSGVINTTNTAAATSVSTGAIIVNGGIGVGGNVWASRINVNLDSSMNGSVNVGGNIRINETTDSTSSTTGALIVGGGAGVAGNLYVGNNLYVTGSIVSPALTGTPSAPTATSGTNTTQIATTAYVRSEISALVASAPGTLDTLNELALALGNDAAFSTTVTNSLALKAPSASPTFTGAFLVSSADSSFNGNLYVDGSIVNTGLSAALALKAPLASPSFTGDVSMNSGLYVGTRIGVGKTANALYGIDVSGNVNLSGNIYTNGVLFSAFDNAKDISLNANLTVARDSSFNSGLYVGTRIGVGKTANALYGIDVSGNVNLSGNIFTNGVLFSAFDNTKDISLNANLTVARDSSFNANLYVGGIMNVAGFVNADAYVERFVTVASSTGTYIANFNNGLVIYVNAFSGSTTPTLSITNLPTTLNQSYVFSVVYKGLSTTTYFSALNINGISVPVNGTVSLTATTTYYVHQFCIFFTDATTISNNFVVQNFSSSAPVGLISPTIYNDSTFNGNINLTGAGNVYKNGALFDSFNNAKDISLNANLTVARDSSFNSNLFVGGSIVNAGLTNALALKAPLAAPSFTGTMVSAGDVSLNTGLRVASDSSFNANIYVGGSIVNTGLSAALALKAPLDAPSFTGLMVSAGDMSLNAGLRVASDSSFNGNLFINGTIVNTGLTSALSLKAPLESPALTGIPTSTTAALGTNTTQIATTEYVRGEISALVASAPGTLDTLNELALALGNDAAFSTTITNSIGLKAPSASPTFTGAFLVSSADSSFNGNLYVGGSIVNTGLTAALALKAPLDAPSFTGDVSMNAGLRLALDASINRGLYVGTRIGVGKTANALYGVDISGNVNLSGNIFANGVLFSPYDNSKDISLNANLIVARDSSFNGNLYVGGIMNVAGFVNADSYVEKFVTVASSTGTYVANFNNGLVIYVNAFSGSTTPTLSITNLPTVLNQSYVFSVVYRGNATSTYFSALNINGTSVPVNGTVSLTAASTYYVHQFSIFFTDATTISNNLVIQNFSSSAPVGLVSPTIYNDSQFNGNINLSGAITLGYSTAPTLQTQLGYITEASGNLINYTSGGNSQPIADWTTGTPKTLSKGVWMINYYIYANDAQTFNITDIRSGLSTTSSGAYTWNVRDLYYRCPATFATTASAFDFCTQITGILNVPASTNYTFDVNLATSVNTSDWNFSIKAVRIG